MTVAVIIGSVALICLSGTLYSVAKAFRESLREAFRALDRNAVRHQAQVDSLLDRLMTIKWEDYAVVRSTNDDEAGGFFPPGLPAHEDEDDELVVDDGKWGHLSNLRERLRVTTEEQALIDEDFDEAGNARKD